MSVLSSGEKQLLNTIGAIIYHIQNIESTHSYNTINLILEEIELYFHPDYQRLFIYRLLKQIYGADLKHIKNINITFVTHSPFILSDIPKCNVLFLNNGEPDYTMQDNTFGANIHSMLKNAFFLPNLLIGEFAYQKINELFRQLNGYQYRNTDIASLKQKITIVGEPYLREQLFKLLRIR
jgi:predicted ATP-binding protein involved in virulence